MTLWLVILGMSLATFAQRASFLLLPPHVQLPALLVGLPGLAKTKLVETLGTVLGLDAQYASESEIPLLQDLLHSGVSLCRVMNAVRPGTIGPRTPRSRRPTAS